MTMDRCNHIPAFLLLALLCQPVAGLAADVAEGDEDLALAYGDKSTISIATGTPQALRRAPAVAAVVTAEEIAAMGATDLDEVLESIAGVHVTRTAVAYAPMYVVRGVVSAFTPQTLVLQNGIPVTTLFQGNKGNAWGGLPVENIARVEVIRGPGSALYGADAYSGVINIITKAAADVPGTEIGARAGSFNTRSGWVQHGGKLGPIDVAAYLRVGGTDGFGETIGADAQSRADQVFRTRASLAPGAVRTGYDAIDGSLDLAYGKWRLRTGYKLRHNLESGAGVASVVDPVGRANSERITSDLSWNDPQFANHWALGLSASYLQYNDLLDTAFMLLPPGARTAGGVFPDGAFGTPQKWERQLRLAATATYTGFNGHSIRMGGGHDDLDLYKTSAVRNYSFTAAGALLPLSPLVMTDFSDTATFMSPHRRKLSYAYVQDEWRLAPDWTLTAGLRRDLYSDVGGTTNPRFALVWEAAYDLTAKLLYGEAFRAPAFVELYSINNPVANGNPNLRPETVRTWEGVVAWARRDTKLTLSLFRYDMSDIIRLVANPTPGTGATYQNTGGQVGRGFEVEAEWNVKRDLRLTAQYAHQESIDTATTKDAGYAPRDHAYVRADWLYGSPWIISAQLNWVANRRRAAGDTRAAIPDYKTVDVTVRTDPKQKGWSFAASVRNLFDTDAREPSLYAPPVATRPDIPTSLIPGDLPLPRRALWVEARYGFR